MPVTVDVRGVEQLVHMGRVMKEVAPDLRKSMKKSLASNVSKPILSRMREEAMAMQVHGAGSGPRLPGRGRGGMRRAIAMSVRSVVADTGQHPGVRVETVPSRMKRGRNSELLPQYADEDGAWRHPVMGNRRAWTTTTTSTGWFSRPAVEGMETAHEEFVRVLDEFIDQLVGRM